MDTFFVNDCIELAALLLGLDTEDPDMDAIEDKLYDKYNIDFAGFTRLIDDLVPFTPTWRSILSKQYFQGFVNYQGEDVVMSVVKREYKRTV